MALARLTTAAQLGVVGVMTLGDQLFAYLGMEPPALYVANRERRVGVCLGAWLLGNAAHNALTATGAFEVFYDGRLVRALPSKRSRRANAWAPGCAAASPAPRAWTAGPSEVRLDCGLVCAHLKRAVPMKPCWWPLRCMPCGKSTSAQARARWGRYEARAPPLLHVRNWLASICAPTAEHAFAGSAPCEGPCRPCREAHVAGGASAWGAFERSGWHQWLLLCESGFSHGVHYFIDLRRCSASWRAAGCPT